MIVIKVCSHSREVIEYLTSFCTDIFVRPLKLNLLSVFTPNISTSLLKFANLFWPIHSDIFHDFMSYNFDRTNQSLSWNLFQYGLCNSLPILNKPIIQHDEILPRHSSFSYCLFRFLKIFIFSFSLLWCKWTSNSVSQKTFMLGLYSIRKQ